MDQFLVSCEESNADERDDCVCPWTARNVSCFCPWAEAMDHLWVAATNDGINIVSCLDLAAPEAMANSNATRDHEVHLVVSPRPDSKATSDRDP